MINTSERFHYSESETALVASVELFIESREDLERQLLLKTMIQRIIDLIRFENETDSSHCKRTLEAIKNAAVHGDI